MSPTQKLRIALSFAAVTTSTATGWAQVQSPTTVTPISLTDTGYTQDFASLASTGSNIAVNPPSNFPSGWAVIRPSGTTYSASTGSGTSGDVYSYGVAGTNAVTDRALGSLLTATTAGTSIANGTVGIRFGSAYRNDTDTAASSITVSYTGEQWRAGASGDSLTFEYSTTASSFASTTGWTAVSGLTFNAPVTAINGATLDGNLAANRASLTATFNATVAAGSGFLIRWNDAQISGNDAGLAVDDVSVSIASDTSAVPEPAIAMLITLASFPTLTRRTRTAVNGLVRKRFIWTDHII